MVFFAYLGFFVLAFILIILILGLSLLSRLFGGIGNILRLFGIGRKLKARTHTYYNNGSGYSQSTSYGQGTADNSQNTSYTNQQKRHTSQEHNSASNGKIFGSNEGEYVDFEEIK